MPTTLIFCFILVLQISSSYRLPFRVPACTSLMSHSGDSCSTNTVEIYTTLGCKYCRRAKALLNSIQVGFESFDVDEYRERVSLTAEAVKGTESSVETESERRYHHAATTTVPQLYLGSEWIGGCQELEDMIKSGELYEKCEALGISFSREMLNHVTNRDEPSSVPSSENEYMSDALYLNNESCGQKLTIGRVGDVFALSIQLQKSALGLMDSFSTPDGLGINYREMRRSEEFKKYIAISSELREVPLHALAEIPGPKRLSLFANLYNALILHATCVLGASSITSKLAADYLFILLLLCRCSLRFPSSSK